MRERGEIAKCHNQIFPSCNDSTNKIPEIIFSSGTDLCFDYSPRIVTVLISSKLKSQVKNAVKNTTEITYKF